MYSEGMPFWLWTLCRLTAQRWARWYRLPLCASHGRGIQISAPRHLLLSGPGIHIGAYSQLQPHKAAPIHLSSWPHAELPPQISIGDYCSIGPGVQLVAAQRIELGTGCLLAADVYITDADWHEPYHRVFPPGPAAPVVIGANVWLGHGAKVLKGVSIGDNSIVGAGAVVTRDIPANSVTAGNPARVIRTLDGERFSVSGGATTRRELFETLDFPTFDTDYWRRRLAPNTLAGWLMGLGWPAWRREQNRR